MGVGGMCWGVVLGTRCVLELEYIMREAEAHGLNLKTR